MRIIDAQEVALSVSAWFSIGTLDTGNSYLIVRVPEGFPGFLGNSMLGIRAPRSNGLQTGPVRDGDPKAVGAANTLHAQITRLTGCQFDHAVGHVPVTVFACCTLGREDDRVVRWLRQLGEGRCCHL